MSVATTTLLWRALAAAAGLLAAALYVQARMPQHMLAHLLLSLIVPPLTLLGLPGWRPRVPAGLGFLALASVTVVSHLPLALRTVDAHPWLLLPEGAAFLGAGLLFALALWPATTGALAATVAQMAVCALTGAWVAYGAAGQQMGTQGVAAGVLMWVGGGLTYSLAALWIISRLVAREGNEGGARHAHTSP